VRSTPRPKIRALVLQTQNPPLASASQSVICYLPRYPCGQSKLPESISHRSPSVPPLFTPSNPTNQLIPGLALGKIEIHLISWHILEIQSLFLIKNVLTIDPKMLRSQALFRVAASARLCYRCYTSFTPLRDTKSSHGGVLK
jgi:hypothetical protein